MNVSHVDEGTLHAYLDGELSPAETQGVDAHLAQCAGCRERLDEERALIAHAAELLALAAPPDRDVPPFRAGDVKPPLRLWWQLRLPVAWAATVLLALGIGTYLGSGGYTGRSVPAPTSTPLSPTASEVDERAQSRGLVAPETVAAVGGQRHQKGVAKRAAAPRPPTLAAPAVQPAPAMKSLGRSDAASLPPAAAPVPAATTISLESARAALDQDPVVVPGVPIRAARRMPQPGYGEVIVIEQQLDTGTVIELVERRPPAMNLDGVAVTGAAGRADSFAALGRARGEAPAAKMAAKRGALERETQLVRSIGGLEIRISGPLPPDSLQKLLQLVRPLER